MHYELANQWRISSLTGSIDDENESFFDATYGGYDYGVAHCRRCSSWTSCAVHSDVQHWVRAIASASYAVALCGLFVRHGRLRSVGFLSGITADIACPTGLSGRLLGLYYYLAARSTKRCDAKGDSQTGRPSTLPYGRECPQSFRPNSTLTSEDVTNNAVFGGLEWDINEKWAATLGGTVVKRTMIRVTSLSAWRSH